MGSTVYSFLSDSFLFNREALEDQYASFTDAQLQSELAEYRAHVLSKLDELKSEISTTQGRLKFLAERDHFSTRRLMQSALYLDQVILPDPLFPLTERESPNSRVMNRFHNMAVEDTVDRGQLASAATKMRDLTPMVTANYVKFFPLSYFSEPDDKTPLTYSETGFADVLPAKILDQYRRHAEVRSLIKEEKGLIVSDVLEVGRRIAVQFRGHYRDETMLFELFRTRDVSSREEDNILSVAMDLPEEPPPRDHFLWWVMQSIHQTARHHCEEVGKNLALAQELDSAYLTASDFTYTLLGENAKQESVTDFTADCVLNLDLPYIDDISMSDLMSVRENDGDAFQRFRAEMESRLRELRAETDLAVVQTRAEDVMHELAVVQRAEIEQQLARLKKTLPVSVLVGGLSATLVTGGFSVAALVLALASGYPAYSEYRTRISLNPAYFLWRARASGKQSQHEKRRLFTG